MHPIGNFRILRCHILGHFGGSSLFQHFRSTTRGTDPPATHATHSPETRVPHPTSPYTLNTCISRAPPQNPNCQNKLHTNQILFRLGTYRVAFGLTPLLASDRPTGPTSRDNGYHLVVTHLRPLTFLPNLRWRSIRFGHSWGELVFFSIFARLRAHVVPTRPRHTPPTPYFTIHKNTCSSRAPPKTPKCQKKHRHQSKSKACHAQAGARAGAWLPNK